MKSHISILIIAILVISLCVWDTIFTKNTFDYMERESEDIYQTLLDTDISNQDLQEKIFNLNEYWTQKMDILCISISRKDMQPISDYLQYLYASVKNQSQEDAITYSRLLHYNLEGLSQVTEFSTLNLL